MCLSERQGALWGTRRGFTADGVPVARHDNEIGGTTDVGNHPEFADRRATKVIGGSPVTGWFSEDFTYDELSTLRADHPDLAVRAAEGSRGRG